MTGRIAYRLLTRKSAAWAAIFTTHSGLLTESVPITNLTHAKVVWCDRYGLPVEGVWESKLSSE
jgi:hypothetical protein